MKNVRVAGAILVIAIGGMTNEQKTKTRGEEADEEGRNDRGPRKDVPEDIPSWHDAKRMPDLRNSVRQEIKRNGNVLARYRERSTRRN